MTIEEANSIRIADYLHSLGYSPVKQQGINLWYKSPFREESEASFKVNTEREQWYDFGIHFERCFTLFPKRRFVPKVDTLLFYW